MKKIILTGGGSCGHIMPNIALIPELKKHYDDIIYVGEDKGFEKKIATDNGLKFITLNSIKLDRAKLYKNLKIPFVLPVSVYKACKILNDIKPDCVFSKGGYVGLPLGIACKIKDVPLIIHESDNSLGVANKICVNWAKNIIVGNENLCKNQTKFINLGNPIRDEILLGNATIARHELNITRNKPNILIIGGSLGAKDINDVITNNLNALVDKYNIIHICGKGKKSNIIMEGYYPIEFVKNIGDYYALADLIISRSGAGAIAEIKALGKRAILIPLPNNCSRGDQVENAKNSGLVMIEQENLTYETLANLINITLANKPIPSNYDILTSRKIVDVILNASQKND